MPELPEVENVVMNIRKNALNTTILNCEIFYEKLIRNMNCLEFIEKIKNNQIKNISRKGKYILINLGFYTLVSHLRMEGKWFFLKNNDFQELRFIIAKMILDNGYIAYYLDSRKFGTFDLIETEKINDFKPIKKLAPDANDENLNIKKIYENIIKSSRAIKSILLDQEVIAGIGNIYADEILYESKINPKRKGNEIKFKEFENIIVNARFILNNAILNGGTTILSFYSDVNHKGNFSQYLKVYKREKLNCLNCDQKIIAIKISGRNTRFCPKCQIL